MIEHTMVEDHAPYFGPIWESNSTSSHCHACRKTFSPMVTRHHCRSCAWIFCNDCAVPRPSNANRVCVRAAEFIGSHGFQGQVPNAGKLEPELRICEWCFRGETPGWKLRRKVIDFLGDKRANKNKIAALSGKHRAKDDHIDVLHHAEGALTHVESVLGLGEQHDANGETLPLTREGFADADYGDERPAPRSGHFEFLNKSSGMCAVKVTVMKRTENEDNELVDDAVRPPYMVLEPGEAISASFDPSRNENHLVAHVLYGNKVSMTRGAHIIRDTRTVESVDVIAPCASVENFEMLSSFRMHPVNQNCIVKLKGGAAVSTEGLSAASSVTMQGQARVTLEPRAGSSISRVGIMNWAQQKTGLGVNGVRTIKDKNSIDFDTNISQCKLVASFL